MFFKLFFVSCRGVLPARGRRVRAPSAGRPFTPCGYAVVALAVAGLMLAALILAGPAADELHSALPLSWWFG